MPNYKSGQKADINRYDEDQLESDGQDELNKLLGDANIQIENEQQDQSESDDNSFD